MKRLTLKQRKEMSYSDYLQTDYWKKVRKYVIERDGCKCKLCGKGEEDGTILHVHHRTYEHRGDEMNFPEDLVTLCKDCHSVYHKKEEMIERIKQMENNVNELNLELEHLRIMFPIHLFNENRDVWEKCDEEIFGEEQKTNNDAKIVSPSISYYQEKAKYVAKMTR